MSMNITIRDGIYEQLKKLKSNEDTSFSDVIATMIKLNDQLIETQINQEGRFEGSKTIQGKTILYKIKEI